MMIDAKIYRISELAEVKAGFPFRGSIEEVPNGRALAVQMKDVDPGGGIDWRTVARTELSGRKDPDWLRVGDVLFAFRGTRFYAVCVAPPPALAVCGPHFFHLRMRPEIGVEPAFIAWQINQAPFQCQLQLFAEGSSQLSIRRPILEALHISLPSLACQRHIVALVALAKRERHTLRQLMRNREQQLQALAENLVRASI